MSTPWEELKINISSMGINHLGDECLRWKEFNFGSLTKIPHGSVCYDVCHVRFCYPVTCSCHSRISGLCWSKKGH